MRLELWDSNENAGVISKYSKIKVTPYSLGLWHNWFMHVPPKLSVKIDGTKVGSYFRHPYWHDKRL